MRVRRVNVNTNNEELLANVLEASKNAELLTITVGGKTFKGHVCDVNVDRKYMPLTGNFLISELLEVEVTK